MKARSPIPADPQPVEQVPLYRNATTPLWQGVAVGAPLGLALAWILSLSIEAPARTTTVATPIPAQELAQIERQARALCTRARAGAPTMIQLPDGVLVCTGEQRRPRSQIAALVPTTTTELKP